jgi:hypothetical protein
MGVNMSAYTPGLLFPSNHTNTQIERVLHSLVLHMHIFHALELRGYI